VPDACTGGSSRDGTASRPREHQPAHGQIPHSSRRWRTPRPWSRASHRPVLPDRAALLVPQIEAFDVELGGWAPTIGKLASNEEPEGVHVPGLKCDELKNNARFTGVSAPAAPTLRPGCRQDQSISQDWSRAPGPRSNAGVALRPRTGQNCRHGRRARRAVCPLREERVTGA
jgi:hypothetical protein